MRPRTPGTPLPRRLRQPRQSRPPPRRPRARSFTALVTLIPICALLYVLFPYLWPPDHAPSSYFSDIHHQHAPNLRFLAQALEADGELPRWNPHDFAGMPTLGDLQAGVYNPAYWILLLDPRLHSFGLMIVAYALLGAIGFTLYARRLGCSVAAAAAGALVFTLGGKLLLHLVLPGHTVKAPFFLAPLVLWAIDRTAARPGPGRVGVTAVLAALMVVALHPQVLLYAAVVLVVIGLATALRAPHPGRALAALAGAALLASALAAVHVLPFLELADEFSRLHPELYNVARWDAQHPDARAHALELIAGTAGSWEAHFYCGGATLWLVFLGLFAWPARDDRRGLAWLHGTLAVVLLLYGLGPDGGIQPLFARLPGFGLMRIPARALTVLGLPLAILSALGVEALRAAPARRTRIVAVAAAVAAGVLLVLGNAPVLSIIALAAALGGGTSLLICRTQGAVPIARSAPADDLHGVVLVGVLVLLGALAIDSGSAVAPWVATARETDIGRPPPAVRMPLDLSDAVRIAEMGRDTVTPGIPPLTVRRLGLETLSGYNPLIPWRFIVFAAYASGYSPSAFNVGDAVPLLHARPALFDLLGVTHILHAPPTDGGPWRWERRPSALPRAYLAPSSTVVTEGKDDDAVQAELEALEILDTTAPRDRVILHGSGARRALVDLDITADTELEPYRAVPLVSRHAHRMRLRLDTTHPAILVLNTPFFRGWQARANGQPVPILRANVLLQAIVLPSGAHEVVFEFAPWSWRAGWWISVIAAAGLAVALGLAGLQSLGRHRWTAAALR